MIITYSPREADVTDLIIDGNVIKYRIPPATGTHPEVFQALSADIVSGKIGRIAQGREIVAYADGCLVHRKNEWQDQDRVKFPYKNYLRFPNVLAIVPITPERKFGDLERGMLVDSDLKGEGIEKQIEIPQDLGGWKASEAGIFIKDNRFFVPYDNWYKEHWDETNGALISLCTLEGAQQLAKTSRDSGRNYRTFWKVDPNEITSPEKRVPVLFGLGAGGLLLDCDDLGNDGDGCGVGVL